jgi:hypothetical protein
LRLALQPRLTRLRAVLLSAVVLAVVACASAGDSKAARKMEIALQDDPVFVLQAYSNRERALSQARSLGVTRLKINASWAFLLPAGQRSQRTKPAAPAYSFGLIDSAILAAARYGIRVHVALTGPAPAWATSNRVIGPRRPNAQFFGEFASAAAQHFRGRVDRYSIWNEPNWHGWLAPLRSSPTLYRNLYRRGYAAIKAAAPGAKVLIGETAPYAQRRRALAPITFLKRVACRGCPKLKADGYAHHPYLFRRAPTFPFPGRNNATIGTLRNLTRALDRLRRSGRLRGTRGGRLPLYLTEYGYFASTKRKLPSRTSARYLKQGFRIALRNPRVKSQLQYLLVSPPKSKPYSFFDLGLMKTSGKKHSTYNALRSFYLQNKRKLKRPGPPIRF